MYVETKPWDVDEEDIVQPLVEFESVKSKFEKALKAKKLYEMNHIDFPVFHFGEFERDKMCFEKIFFHYYNEEKEKYVTAVYVLRMK